MASSIESLSSINQELHWKLQQQRLAMFFGGETQKEMISTANNSSIPVNEAQMIQKPQPILFQNLDISKPEAFDGKDCGENGSASLATEWLFDNTYAQASELQQQLSLAWWRVLQSQQTALAGDQISCPSPLAQNRCCSQLHFLIIASSLLHAGGFRGRRALAFMRGDGDGLYCQLLFFLPHLLFQFLNLTRMVKQTLSSSRVLSVSSRAPQPGKAIPGVR
nr:dof zinc finger protein DOF5.7-like [Ipomoea batatas]